ncbi:hypothetical protein [Xenorhabdus anantnagensis]|uniref:Uncharacterized protein n=1 Tax=Xenorhabdus anantnagensis TaxID=3025875 RepID=A0ABT5LLL8_9GAMM|nr:hypothetical protein [Xenorhabdus anantnagensis]MDC9595305.1 hypothetical protein [Xenorhabdus anantnagensis]
MEKNIMVVFGYEKLRENYLKELYSQRENGDVYITIDILNHIIGVDFSRDDNKDLKSMRCLIENDGGTEYHFYNTSSNHSDTYLIDYISRFYQYVSGLACGNKMHLMTNEKIMEIKRAIDENSVNCLLRSWSNFLKKEFYQISLHDTFSRRTESSNKNGSGKFYANYMAGFLAKNIPFMYVNEREKHEKKMKLGKSTDYKTPFNAGLFNSLRDKDYTANAFGNYLRSDKEGISNILKLKEEADQIKLDKDSKQDIYDKKIHGEIISKTFMRSYWRKISKLSVDWVEAEAKNPNSPIKGLLFYMEKNIPFNKYNARENINKLKFESNYRHCDYKNIGSLDYHSAITDSEYRYAQKRRNQNIEEVRVNDKNILNRIRKFMNKI